MNIKLLIFILTLSLYSFANIDQKIVQNKTALQEQKEREQKINKKLEELGEKVNKQKAETNSLQKVIEESEKNINKNKKEYENKSELIKKLSSNQEDLFKQRKKIEQEIVDLVIKDVSFSILLNDYQPESIQDLITEESFKILNKNTKEHIENLSEEQKKVVSTLANLQSEIEELKKFIEEENKKKENLKSLQEKENKLLASYEKEIKNYNEELKNIVKERDSIQEILVNLNILKSQEAEKKKKQAELAKQELATPKESPKSNTTQAQIQRDFDVRQVASSYHNISTTKYKGAKTIAPLDDYEIEKRFGPYYDPVYKMKVFNESITITPKGDDKVKSVLDGKVVFAKDTPVLKRVVIIEHKDNMHTIYAQLDKIAPTIKPGSSVKKGYTIGRVDKSLKFEVTLKDKHIDPLELIAQKSK